MKHITVGVAGHIDHGKTALVRALTGMETDRLPEERERGMSIALGFAYLPLPEGQIDLIDVPGHEKFIKTMIAGATGTEAVLLVVAATERIMPQTVEHLALCELLGIRKGFVVVNKSDLAPADERDSILTEIRSFLTTTFLSDAPLIFASAITDEGIAEIRAVLTKLLAESTPPVPKPGFYLPIDRVFSMTGHGTVVTGTLRRGRIRVGDSAQVYPSGRPAQVRGIEVHGVAVEESGPGWRTAVNLRGISMDEIARGDTLASPDALFPTTVLDAELTLLPARLRLAKGKVRPIRHGETVHVYYGTRESQARLHLLDRNELCEGETALVQLRFGDPQAAPVGERFVLRAFSPMETIGGGCFIDIAPARHTRRDKDVLRQMRVLVEGSAAERLFVKIHTAGYAGRGFERLQTELDISSEEWEAARGQLPVVLIGPDLMLSDEYLEKACEQIRTRIYDFHTKHPTLRGIPQAELRKHLPKEL
ncbi:MAG TPA: selenocysteine-specific translation elongation factor, partial [Capsulimonadaceae bacterium]|nr:selenocysteine-specific translation elongation factor [Capsulimonadaceae bacterium]